MREAWLGGTPYLSCKPIIYPGRWECKDFGIAILYGDISSTYTSGAWGWPAPSWSMATRRLYATLSGPWPTLGIAIAPKGNGHLGANRGSWHGHCIMQGACQSGYVVRGTELAVCNVHAMLVSTNYSVILLRVTTLHSGGRVHPVRSWHLCQSAVGGTV